MTVEQNAEEIAIDPAPAAASAQLPVAADLERWGYSLPAAGAQAKRVALEALAQVIQPTQLPSVQYVSRGNTLVIGGDERAVAAAARLATTLPVTLLLTSRPSAQAAALASADLGSGTFPIWGGKVTSLRGHLGDFTATLADLAAVRAGAALPAGAVAVFDLVLDFSDPPLFGHHQPPQGYWRIGDEASLESALEEAAGAVGEFDKPRFFDYRANLCAHSRSGIAGCERCIEVCSTEAIAADGDHVKVDPHLCMGCGACASVCPSGAMGFRFPGVADRGAQLRALLGAYRGAGGRDACLLFHNGTDGRELLRGLAAGGGGLPARVVPLESWHVASIGIDLMLGAVALGASQVAILSAGSEAPEYGAALREQVALAQAIVSGLGYEGKHFALVEAGSPAVLGAALEALSPARGPDAPGIFALSDDKRTSVEFAVEHLARHAPSPVTRIALPAGAPYGEVIVDQGKCTLCLACAGACPESALMDGGDVPRLRFLERNCVQCGLCERTCPEDAISLAPGLLLGPAAREARVLNEAQPFHCVSCGKAFGTRQMVDAMLGRLAGHAMFSDPAAKRRLQMCGDCRIVDMMSSKSEVSVLKL